MPYAASPCARSFRLSFGAPGKLPSRSTGPEPAMIRAAGNEPDVSGSVSVPRSPPLLICCSVHTSATAGTMLAARPAIPIRPAFTAPLLSMSLSVLDRPGQPVGLHLGPHLRHIMPEHDNVVLATVDVPHVVAQQRFGLEAEALEQRDCALLIDRHLHRQF